MSKLRSSGLLCALSLALLYAGACGAAPAVQSCEGDGCADTLGDIPMSQPQNLTDPGQPGPRKVARFTLGVPVAAGAAVTVTVSGPSDDGTTISRSGAPFPLVVISPGFFLSRTQYNAYAARLASFGIVALTQDPRDFANHAQIRDDSIAVISWMLAPTGPSAGKVSGRIDGARVGVTGHSLGGKVSFLVAAKDPRVTAVLGIDPVDGGVNPQAGDVIGGIHLPGGAALGMLGEIVSESGSSACAPAADNYEVLLGKASTPAFAIRFNRSAHTDFVDNTASCFACLFCPGGTIPTSRTHDLAVKYTTAYFMRTLGQQPSFEAYLSGAPFLADAATGDVAREVK